MTAPWWTSGERGPTSAELRLHVLEVEGAAVAPSPEPQVACDRCTFGVMDSTNPHLLGTCTCPCHTDAAA
jgi:hypothetical protein